MSLPRRKLPSLNALRAFEASGRRLNFRAAAEELGVTQGAVAQQVRGLEEHLGQTLFQRLPRSLALTVQGAAYLSKITRAFDILGEATNELIKRPDTVTISVTPTFAAKLLIPRLGELNTLLPGIELRTVATEALSDFERDQVDIAIRLTRPPFPPGQEALRLFQQELVAVAAPHFLKDIAIPITSEKMRKLPLLHDSHNHWSMFLATSDKLPGAVFNQTTLALEAALAGQGVALACRAFVAKDIGLGRLIQVMTETKVIEPDYFLVRKRTTSPQKTVESVWQWCLNELVLTQAPSS